MTIEVLIMSNTVSMDTDVMVDVIFANLIYSIPLTILGIAVLLYVGSRLPEFHVDVSNYFPKICFDNDSVICHLVYMAATLLLFFLIFQIVFGMIYIALWVLS